MSYHKIIIMALNAIKLASHITKNHCTLQCFSDIIILPFETIYYYSIIILLAIKKDMCNRKHIRRYI